MISYTNIRKLNKILREIERLEQRYLYILFCSRDLSNPYSEARSEIIAINNALVKLRLKARKMYITLS